MQYNSVGVVYVCVCVCLGVLVCMHACMFVGIHLVCVCVLLECISLHILNIQFEN